MKKDRTLFSFLKSKIWKQYSITNYSYFTIFFVKTVVWQSANGKKKKIVGSCKNDKQLLVVCHVRIMTKL